MNRGRAPIYLLASVCVFDLVVTCLLIRCRGAGEANPLMARFLADGMGAFVAAKLGFIVVPLLVLEWARRSRPAFVRKATIAAVAAYAVIYAIGSIQANDVRYPTELNDDRTRMLWAVNSRRIAVMRAEALSA